jgi:hypothetical protein
LDAGRIDEHTDFRDVGGNSILLLAMIDAVSRAITGDAHGEFMAELSQIIREPTLTGISDIARKILAR